MHAKFVKLLALIGLGSLLACTELNSPYGSPGVYDRGPYYDGRYDGRYDDYQRRREWEEQRREKRDIERERDRLEDERERLEEERRRQEEKYRKPPPPPQRAPERCPSGFSPSERKCTPQERKKGCQDMRLPGGLGCVKR